MQDVYQQAVKQQGDRVSSILKKAAEQEAIMERERERRNKELARRKLVRQLNTEYRMECVDTSRKQQLYSRETLLNKIKAQTVRFSDFSITPSVVFTVCGSQGCHRSRRVTHIFIYEELCRTECCKCDVRLPPCKCSARRRICRRQCRGKKWLRQWTGCSRLTSSTRSQVAKPR